MKIHAPVPASQFEASAKLQKVETLLASAKSIADLREVRAKASAVFTYFKSLDAGISGVVNAATVKLKAERRLGEFIRSIPKNEGGRPSTKTPVTLTVVPKTLAEQGIEENESRRWQLLAGIPDVTFESYVAQCIAARKPPTCAGALRRVVNVDVEQSKREPQWDVLDSLGGLRRKFNEVFGEFIDNANGDFEPLLHCLRSLASEVESECPRHDGVTK